jgi:hypothetical protein
MGVILANSGVSERNQDFGTYSRWQMSSQGYLDLRTFGYSLAVFAFMRGEETPTWAKHLRQDVRSTMRRGSRWLSHVGISVSPDVSTFTLPTTLAKRAKDAKEWTEAQRDAYEYMTSSNRECTYCDAMLPDDAESLICEECQADIEENERELEAEYEAANAPDAFLRFFKYFMCLFGIALFCLLAYEAIKSVAKSFSSP